MVLKKNTFSHQFRGDFRQFDFPPLQREDWRWVRQGPFDYFLEGGEIVFWRGTFRFLEGDLWFRSRKRWFFSFFLNSCQNDPYTNSDKRERFSIHRSDLEVGMLEMKFLYEKKRLHSSLNLNLWNEISMVIQLVWLERRVQDRKDWSRMNSFET